MTQQKFKLSGPIRNAQFTVREDHTLAIDFKLKSGEGRTLVFHDFIRKPGKRFFLFNEKTELNQQGNQVVIRTAAADGEDGEPIPGLLVNYRFTFDKKLGAFYVSVSYNSDVRCSGYTVKLMDVSWEGMEVQNFTGYEYDAEDKPFSHTFSMPAEKNPLAPDYETLMRIRPHVAWERMKTRPLTFKNGVAVHGDKGYFAVWGGTPTFHVEAEYVNVFTNIDAYDNDLRYFSGKNSPGAWFLLEEPEDMFQAVAELNKRLPELPEHVMAPFVEKTVALDAGAMKMHLRQTGNGVWVEPAFAGKDVSCQPWPLFYIDLWDTQYERPVLTDGGDGWDRVEILEKKNYVRVTLSDPDSGRVTGITVVAEAFLDALQNRISWKMKLVNRSDRWSVTKISYPQCLAQGFETGFGPVGSGSILKQFNKRSYSFRGKYPTGMKVNMAFLALYNDVPMEKAAGSFNGLYMGIHDPNGNPKFLYMTGAPQSDCTMLTADCVPHYQRHAGNSFTLPGTMVWQRFSGDWFDATEIYRDFVFTQSKWLSPVRGRADSSEWMRNTPVWIMHFMPNENPDANPFPITLREKYADKNPEDWYRTAVRFRQEIGVPVSYHLYNWHWVPFNNDNPHYFPAHSDLKAGMAELKKADIRVVPYIAGYSWDMCDHRGGDYRFEQEALPATAKNIKGEPIFTSYASTEPTGQAVRFARMCPSTTTWKNEVRQIVKKLYSDFKMDGIYLDVVSTAYEMCCDESHLHMPGHGDFWWKAYCELIAGLRADAPADFAMVSESTSEVYSGILDGYLSCGPMALTGSTRMQSSTFEQLAGAVALEGALCDLLQAQGIDMQFRGYSWYGEQFASMTAQLLSEKSVSVLADASRVSPTETVGKDDPLSFYGRMKREFYDLVRPDLVMPESQRYFPAPGQEETYDLLIEELGGVDACFGGMGINGHVAFNEPPETDAPMTADEFAVLGTRVLPISRETKTINAYGYNRGDLQGMPQWCVTVGMKQILSAKKVYIALNRSWQNGPFKHALLDEQTANVPASLLQRCKDVTYCGIAEVMDVVI